MITQAQAHATAARWLNPEGHQGPPREVAMQEFDLGWVVWAVPPPPEVDPETGQRRPPAEIGTACGVVDRATGELTVWPSVPVDEVVRMYQQKHGAGADGGTSHALEAMGEAPAQAAAADQPPVTGPGNTAVATYNDPATGEETSLVRVSAPGMPPVEFQLHEELLRLGVRGEDVRAVHTDLRPALLPGGYPGDFIFRGFPNATFSCTEGYGMRPEERAEGIAGLLRHVEMMHQLAGRPAPPRPHRVPVPQNAEPAPPMRDVALGKHLTEVLGPQGVIRPDADDLAATRLPEAAKKTLTWAGLPAQVPYFFTADQVDSPPPGGLFTDVATHLRQTGTETREQTLETLAGYVRLGTDGLYTLAVQCTAPEANQSLVGTVWAVQPSSGGGRFVNRTLAAYLRSLALLATTRQQMRGMDPYAAGAAVAAFQEQIAAIDSWALDDEGNWWSLIIEQMWHGLF
ncbi:SUKH-4 family immunity protein [Streptomyces halobius]|uniref:SUKH-4 family immunity protein n=1 Tax=Streptomyces halobius TaxID=2879846 RepID=A0ABY4M4S1_9ACTN|nr:SUKH-4 family immunity protein [Streptomyces halobius]UQA92757.1 SUKH-4 family immunity protein [Streptomyces halobius]